MDLNGMPFPLLWPERERNGSAADRAVPRGPPLCAARRCRCGSHCARSNHGSGGASSIDREEEEGGSGSEPGPERAPGTRARAPAPGHRGTFPRRDQPADGADGMSAGAPTGAGACSGCGAPFEPGTSYLVDCGRRYHRGCFRCSHCGRSLEKGFVRHGGLPYCAKDYAELFAPRCACGCDEPVPGERVLALGGAWKPSHFRCADCGALLSGTDARTGEPTPFVRRPAPQGAPGAPVCVGCHASNHARRCAVCDSPLVNCKVVRNGWGQVACAKHVRAERAARAPSGALGPQEAGSVRHTTSGARRAFECFACSRFLPLPGAPHAGGLGAAAGHGGGGSARARALVGGDAHDDGRRLCEHCVAGALAHMPRAERARSLAQVVHNALAFLTEEVGLSMCTSFECAQDDVRAGSSGGSTGVAMVQAAPVELVSLDTLAELMRKHASGGTVSASGHGRAPLTKLGDGSAPERLAGSFAHSKRLHAPGRTRQTSLLTNHSPGRRGVGLFGGDALDVTATSTRERQHTRGLSYAGSGHDAPSVVPAPCLGLTVTQTEREGGVVVVKVRHARWPKCASRACARAFWTPCLCLLSSC